MPTVLQKLFQFSYIVFFKLLPYKYCVHSSCFISDLQAQTTASLFTSL